MLVMIILVYFSFEVQQLNIVESPLAFFSSCLSGRGNRIGPVRLCVCVCVSVSALTTEPLDLWTQYLVQE